MPHVHPRCARALFALTLVVTVPSNAQEAASSGNVKPFNIVLILSDDHSYPHLGVYGDGVARTPNLDALAARGVLFNHAYVTSPQCSPSRTSMWAGQNPHALTTSRLNAPLPEGTPNLVGALRSAGYYTAGVGKMHCGRYFLDQFDDAVPRFKFKTGDIDRLGNVLDRIPADRPFFFYLGLVDPHRPYVPDTVDVPTDPESVRVPPFLHNGAQTRKELAQYYDEVHRADLRVGQVLEWLDEHGVADRTIVLFGGDNGLPFPGAKGSLYDPGVRVPLIVASPGQGKSGRVTDAMVSFEDLAPTLLEAVGVPTPTTMTGRSFAGLLRGEKDTHREHVFVERNVHDTTDFVRAIRTTTHKLILNYQADQPYQVLDDSRDSATWKAMVALHDRNSLSPELDRRYFSAPRPAIEFYDLVSDPWELNNLASEPARQELISEMARDLDAWMDQTNDFLQLPRHLSRPLFPPGEPGNAWSGY